MERQNEREQPKCPYCGKPLAPGWPCRCPQARLTEQLRRAARPKSAKPAQKGLMAQLRQLMEPPEDDDYDEEEEFEEFMDRLLQPAAPLRFVSPEEREGDEEPEQAEQTPPSAPPPELPPVPVVLPSSPFGADGEESNDDDDYDEWEEWEESPRRLFFRELAAPFRNFFPFLAAYFRAPMQAVEAACRGKDLLLAQLYLLVFLLSGGAFLVVLTQRSGSFLGWALELLLSQSSFPVRLPRLSLQVDLGRGFFYGALALLCLVLLASLAAAVCCRLAKVRLGFQRSLILCSLSSPAPALFLLLAAAAMSLFPALAFCLALLAAIGYFALVFHAVCRAAGQPAGGLFCFSLLLLLFLAFLLSFLFAAKLLGPSFAHVLRSLLG